MVKIGKHTVGQNQPCLIIAEAGINHNGDIAKARMLVDAAAECGADVIKFQTHFTGYEMLPQDITADYIGESLFDLIKRLELSREDHIELKEYAAGKGILFLSTPFSREAADLLDEIGVPAFKIGSGEMANLPLLKHVAEKGKPIILSTGMNTLEAIKESVIFLRQFTEDLVILHCVSSYPARYEDLNLRFIRTLQNEFELPVGISDHSIGIYTALAAVALGACLVEKHFTIDREWPGPDQKASIVPSELAEMVTGIRAVEKALGVTLKKVADDEIPVREMAFESVVSLVDIPSGAFIEEDMVWVKRPGTGIPAKDLEKVIGRTAIKDIKAHSLIKWADLSE